MRELGIGGVAFRVSVRGVQAHLEASGQGVDWLSVASWSGPSAPTHAQAALGRLRRCAGLPAGGAA